MSEIIGALVNFGYGEEVTKGTAVAPTKWLGKYDFSFIPKSDKVMNESSYGHISKTSGQITTRKYGEGSVTAKIFDAAIGDFMKMACGKAPVSSAVSGQTGAYDHVFTVQNDNAHKSYTLAVEEGSITDSRYPGAILSSLNLDFAVDDYAKMSATFLSEEGASASNTPTFTQENEFSPEHASIKVVAKGGDLDAASINADVRSASLEISKNPLKKETLSTTTIQPKNGRMEVKGEIELYYDATTFKTYWDANTELALRIKIDNTDVTIGTDTSPSLQIDLPFMMVADWQPDYSNDDQVMQTINFVGHYDASTGDFVEITLRNTTASYPDAS